MRMVALLPQPVAWPMWSLNLLPGNKISLVEAGAIPQSSPFHNSTNAQVSAKGRHLLVSSIGSCCLPLVVKARHQRCCATRKGASCYQKLPDYLVREVSKLWGTVRAFWRHLNQLFMEYLRFDELSNFDSLWFLRSVTNETQRDMVRLVV